MIAIQSQLDLALNLEWGNTVQIVESHSLNSGG